MINHHKVWILFMPVILFSFMQCSSQKKLQKTSPLTFGEVYCQAWVAGVKGGGSGINIYIPVDSKMNSSIELDSVYFRGKSSKLERSINKTPLYIGRFKTGFNERVDITMSSDSTIEYGNEVPSVPEKIPFKLENDECVVSYKDQEKVKYFKISNVKEKLQISYPQARPIKQ